jgi:hypothetical protein
MAMTEAPCGRAAPAIARQAPSFVDRVAGRFEPGGASGDRTFVSDRLQLSKVWT